MRKSLIVGAALSLATALTTAACNPPPEPPLVMDSSVVVDGRGIVPALVCPGAKGCERASGALRVGAAARAITPVVGGDEPVWMAGFDIGREATGVHDDTWTRAIVVEQGDVRAGLVVIDCVGFFHHDVVRVRRQANERGGAFDQVLVMSTHTHETKDTMGMWGSAVGDSGYDDVYMQFVVDQATDALIEAAEGLRDASMTVARAAQRELVRDSRLPEIVDDSLHVVHFDAVESGAPVATLVVWGNHPEALGADNTEITSDYPHFLRARVEERLPGTTAVFAPGILGGLTTTIGVRVCPDPVDGSETCPQGTFERARVIGETVADAAVDVLLSPEGARDEPAPALALRRAPVMLTPTNAVLGIAFQLGMLARPVFETSSGALIDPLALPSMSIDDVSAGLVQIDSEVSALSIGGVELLTVPGELYAELWLAGPDGAPLVERPANADFPNAQPEPAIEGLIARDATTTKIVLNQGNDAVGYIIPESQFDQDAPYAYEPEGQYGEQNSLGPLAAREITDAIAALYALVVE